MTIWNNIFFYMAIAIVGAAFYLRNIWYYEHSPNEKENKVRPIEFLKWRIGRKEGEEESKTSRYCFVILMLLVFLLAFGIRVFKFGEIPGGVNQDGAMAAVDAKALADYGTDRFGMRLPVHFTAWGYGQMSVLLSYLMVPFIKLFGLSTITARLPMLIVSMLGLLCLALLTKEIAGKSVSFIVTLLAAINPWHILQSRWALDCNLFPHFFLFGLYFLYRGLKKKWNIYLSMFFFAMCMYCYGISFYTVPVFLLAACIYLLYKKKIKLKDVLICIAVYFIFAWPIYTVMIINFLKLNTITTPFFTMPFFPNSVRSEDILFFSKEPLNQLAVNFKSMLNATLFQKKDLPWNDVAGFGTMYLCTMPFVVAGVIVLIKKCKENVGYVLIGFALLTGIWSGLITANVNVNRINLIYYVLIILAGFGIAYSITYIKQLKPVVLAMYAILFVLFISTYFGKYAKEMEYYFYDGFTKALNYVKELDVDRFYITSDVQYEGSTQVSEIITLFEHEVDAKYYQGVTCEVEGKVYEPYHTRYIYSSMKDIDINPSENAVYIITAYDKQYFDELKFEFKDFSNFSVVERK